MAIAMLFAGIEHRCVARSIWIALACVSHPLDQWQRKCHVPASAFFRPPRKKHEKNKWQHVQTDEMRT